MKQFNPDQLTDSERVTLANELVENWRAAANHFYARDENLDGNHYAMRAHVVGWLLSLNAYGIPEDELVV